jgi:hypothetical protein
MLRHQWLENGLMPLCESRQCPCFIPLQESAVAMRSRLRETQYANSIEVAEGSLQKRPSANGMVRPCSCPASK